MEQGKLAYTPNSAAQALGMSRSHLYSLMAVGAIRYIVIGRRRRIPAEELQRVLSEGTAPKA
jgi:excisionase family DNA binding protein